MEPSMRSERKLNLNDSNQFINATKSTSSDERDNISVNDDSVLSICPQCNFSTTSIQSLDTHMEQEHGDNTPPTQERNETQETQSFSMPVKEENVDNNEEYFANIGLDNQTKSDSSSVNSSSIIAGKHISDSRRRYRCNICPVTFPWHGDLAAHLSEVHGFQKASRDGGKTRAGSYKCSFCMYVAKYQSELKRHRRLHMGVKPFGCVFCKYRSAWKGDLKRHIESHHRGHFNSEEELAAIMAQYKNNAGTDIKGAVGNESQLDSFSSQIQQKDEFNDTMTSTSDRSKFSENFDSFMCDKGSFATTNKQKATEHILQCPLINFQSFENSKIGVQKFSPSFEMGLNLTLQSHTAQDFPISFNPNRSFCNSTTNNFPSITTINDSILKIPPSIKNISNISNPLTMSSYMQDINNDLLSVMGSQNNISFNDFVGRMFSNINGMIPSQILPNSLSNNSLLDSSSKTSNLINNTPIFSKASKSNSNNFDNLQHQLASSFKTINKDFSKEYEFQCPQNTNHFDSEKGFKSINSIISYPRSLSGDTKLKENSSSLMITQQEHWKRFKCSACGHRSNWKWDINKHIKVAHPERDGIATVELSYEEAKTTLQNYLNSTKANKARSHNSFESEEGYYRPYKCSACGHRSNWKWDVNKHIKQVHQRQAEVITLSMEEAKSTICQYKRRRRAPGLPNFSEQLSNTVASTPTGSVIADKSNISSPLENHSSNDNFSEKEKNETTWFEVSPTTVNSQQQNPRIDTLRLKRLKCDCCGYRSNYRSDISRHIRRKHDNMASVVFLADVQPNESSIDPQLIMKMDSNDPTDSEKMLKQMIIIGNNDQLTNQHKKLWQCNLCQFNHKEKIQVSHHITRNHDPERPFNCKLCHYGTDYRNSLLRHVKAKHKISSIHEVMNQNLSKVRYVPSLGKNIGIKMEENDELIKVDSTVCSKCSEVFSNYQDLFQHTVNNHSSSDEEMYLIFKPPSRVSNDVTTIHLPCSLCPFSTTNPDAAQIHQFQHSDICHYLFLCPHCNYKASHNKFLLNHIASHLKSPSFFPNDQPEDLSCPKFKSNNIISSINKLSKSDVFKKKSSKKFHCNKCVFRTTNNCHLRVHLKKNHYKKCFKRNTKKNKSVNNISNFFLMDNDMLAYKRNSPQTERFWCDECGFLTDDEEELRKHLMKHLNNNNNSAEHKCNLCTYNPDSNIDLKNHELLHILYEVSNFKERLNGVYNSLKCDKCNFSTNIIDKLVFHEHFHCMSSNYSVGFSCPKCSFKHFQLYGLIKHLKYHH